MKFSVNHFLPTQHHGKIFYEVMATDHDGKEFMYQRKFDTESQAIEFICMADEEMQSGSALNTRVWIKWN
jgi:hypothetical protein